MNNYTIPCIHPLNQADTETALLAIMKVINSGCGDTLLASMNKIGVDVYQLGIDLGFITFEGTVH